MGERARTDLGDLLALALDIPLSEGAEERVLQQILREIGPVDFVTGEDDLEHGTVDFPALDAEKEISKSDLVPASMSVNLAPLDFVPQPPSEALEELYEAEDEDDPLFGLPPQTGTSRDDTTD